MNVLLPGAMATGLVAGVAAGLLGVGGGILIVPALLALFAMGGVADGVAMQLAVGTSLATIVVTNISATRGHHRRHSVRWDLAWRYAPGILLGAWLGAQLAALLPGETLRRLFGLFEIVVGLQMSLGRQPPAGTAERPLPGTTHATLGVGIGAISSLFGIGGGTLTVPVLTLLAGLPIRHAVGTSSAIGVAIAAIGAAGFIQAGWHNPALPPGSWGFVLPSAFLGIVAGTVVTTPVGVWLAHTLHPARLKRTFGAFLIVVGLHLLGLFQLLAHAG